MPVQGQAPLLFHYFHMIEQWADETGTATPLLDRAIELYQKCVDMGLGETHDVAVMIDVHQLTAARKRPRAEGATHDPRQEDRPRHLRNARSRPAGRVLHRGSRLDRDRQGQGHGLPGLDHRPPLGGAAQGRRSALRAARLSDRAGRRPRRVSRSRPQAHGIKTTRKNDPGTDHRRNGRLRGSQGHGDGGVQARRFAGQRSRARASCRTSSATSRSSSKTSRK